MNGWMDGWIHVSNQAFFLDPNFISVPPDVFDLLDPEETCFQEGSLKENHLRKEMQKRLDVFCLQAVAVFGEPIVHKIHMRGVFT